jgi:oligoendopeptidase F
MAELDIKETEWNLSLLLKSESDSEIAEDKKEVEKAAGDFVKKWKNRIDYLESADSLKEALDDYERLMRFFGTSGKAGFYYWLLREKKQDDTNVMAKYNQLDELSKRISNEIQFFVLNLGKIKLENQKKLLADSILRNYKYFLEKIFIKAKYMLSDEQEKVLNLTESNSYTKWVNTLSSFISSSEREVLTEDGNRKKKNFEVILKLTDNKDKEVRDCAANAVNDIFLEHIKIAEAELNAVLAYKKTIDELRGYERADSSRHLADSIDSGIVDLLIEEVTKSFDISHRFYELKAKLLGLKKLEYHERNVEYGKTDRKYPYVDAVKLVYDVFERLDRSFAQTMKDFVENGRIDVYPKKGKRGGAFCAHELISFPIYILLNHVDRLDDVTTLAHELGHGINYELMKKSQNSLNFGTCLATAEVASTFMEDFVVEELLKEADDETRLAILLKKTDDCIKTIIRQTACYNFEKELHSEFRKKGFLSREEIGKIFQKNMNAYMGPFVEQSPGSENWWVHWWHIREYFYVYSYASGLLISKSLQKEVKKNPVYISTVKDFLSSGLSDSPRNIFLKLGIDITKKEFWDNGLKEIESLLNKTEKLAKKLKKI